MIRCVAGQVYLIDVDGVTAGPRRVREVSRALAVHVKLIAQSQRAGVDEVGDGDIPKQGPERSEGKLPIPAAHVAPGGEERTASC